MIEGIIQQICKKYISNDALSYEAKNTVYQLEQDLIAEIKKMKFLGPISKEMLIGEE